MDNQILIIYGPTACGKSSLALKIANEIDSVIINADSMQVYKDLRVLSARPSPKDEEKISHKLYGICNASENMSVAKWLKLAKIEIDICLKNKQLPILVGGTGMYLGALLNGLSEIPQITEIIKTEVKNKYNKDGLEALYTELLSLDPNCKVKANDTSRIIRALEVVKQTNKTLDEWNKNNKLLYKQEQFLSLAILPPKHVVDKNIALRTEQMFLNGAVEEVIALNKLNLKASGGVYSSIGVQQVQNYINGLYELNIAIEETTIRTRQYAKRQLTWARGKLPSNSVNVYGKNFTEILNIINNGN